VDWVEEKTHNRGGESHEPTLQKDVCPELEEEEDLEGERESDKWSKEDVGKGEETCRTSGARLFGEVNIERLTIKFG